jgi:hypothetical protein
MLVPINASPVVASKIKPDIEISLSCEKLGLKNPNRIVRINIDLNAEFILL